MLLKHDKCEAFEKEIERLRLIIKELKSDLQWTTQFIIDTSFGGVNTEKAQKIQEKIKAIDT